MVRGHGGNGDAGAVPDPMRENQVVAQRVRKINGKDGEPGVVFNLSRALSADEAARVSKELKQDAIPGRVITGWFEPTMTGTFASSMIIRMPTRANSPKATQWSNAAM